MPASMIASPPTRREGLFLLAVTIAALVLSGIAPKDRLTWLLETIWVTAAIPLIVWRWRAFPLSRLLCWLLVAHALVLIYGGAYTYAETPLGFWLRDTFGFERNPWDRVGHWMQGFVPAILARELLRRTSPLGPGGWTPVLCVACALAFSAIFEMLEWGASVSLGHAADAFLGSQGDPWDAQWDMLCCLVGAIASMLAFAGASGIHERQLERLKARDPAP